MCLVILYLSTFLLSPPGGNILIDRAGKVLKIADFGAAAHMKDCHKFHRLAGTPPYMAPEVVRANEAQGYGMKCDVWSLGCVVIEMATARPPWVQENRRNNRWEILYKVTYYKQTTNIQTNNKHTNK